MADVSQILDRVSHHVSCEFHLAYTSGTLILISNQCDKGAGNTLVAECKTGNSKGKVMISRKSTSVLLVFTAFVQYDVWYLLGELSIYPNPVVSKSRRKVPTTNRVGL